MEEVSEKKVKAKTLGTAQIELSLSTSQETSKIPRVDSSNRIVEPCIDKEVTKIIILAKIEIRKLN